MHEAETEHAFPNLEGAEFMLLTTFRRDGTPVPTTVWFAQVGDWLYVTTMAPAGKAKRLRATGRAAVAPATRSGDVLGPELPARGRVLDPAEFPPAVAALRAKYAMFDQVAGDPDANAARGGRIYLEIRPDAGGA